MGSVFFNFLSKTGCKCTKSFLFNKMKNNSIIWKKLPGAKTQMKRAFVPGINYLFRSSLFRKSVIMVYRCNLALAVNML